MPDDDRKRLMDHAINLALHLLSKNGSMYPIGLTIDHGGRIQIHGVQPASTDADGRAFIEELRTIFRRLASADEIRGCAIAYAATIRDAGRLTDAIAVDLEMTDDAGQLLIPIRKRRRLLARTWKVKHGSPSREPYRATVFT